MALQKFQECKQGGEHGHQAGLIRQFVLPKFHEIMTHKWTFKSNKNAAQKLDLQYKYRIVSLQKLFHGAGEDKTLLGTCQDITLYPLLLQVLGLGQKQHFADFHWP